MCRLGFSSLLMRILLDKVILISVSNVLLLLFCYQSNCEGYVSPFLKKELLRLYNKEKTWRERLWKKGIVKSSLMSPRKCPEFVGTEEVIPLFLVKTSSQESNSRVA